MIDDKGWSRIGIEEQHTLMVPSPAQLLQRILEFRIIIRSLDSHCHAYHKPEQQRKHLNLLHLGFYSLRCAEARWRTKTLEEKKRRMERDGGRRVIIWTSREKCV
jgi:hypothetical protein